MDEVTHFLIRHGYILLFLWVFIEQLGLPIPVAPALLAAGALAGAGKLNFGGILLVCILGSMLSDLFWYRLGRHRGNSALALACRISMNPHSCVISAKRVFGRHGAHSLLIAKFFPGLNALSTPLAGAVGMGLLRFLTFDVLGAFIWVGTLAGLGYLFREQIERIAAYLEAFGSWAVILLVGTLTVYLAGSFLRRRRFSTSNRPTREEDDRIP